MPLTAERLKLGRLAICRSSFDTNWVIDAATTSLRCVFWLVYVKTVISVQARNLAAAAFLQRRCVFLLREQQYIVVIMCLWSLFLLGRGLFLALSADWQSRGI